MTKATFVPHTQYKAYSIEEMRTRSERFLADLQRRRTVREYSSRDVPQDVIKNCLLAAGTAPNGANLQPWHFVVIRDPAIKKQIREAAEKEEREFYEHRAPQEWLEALEPLGTDWQKPFLENAPVLIAIFAESFAIREDGKRVKNYYVQESVGIATGILITAVHNAGLVSLTHTPSPMNFLNDILGRPKNERPYLILVVGYPAEDAQIPIISKKPIETIATFK